MLDKTILLVGAIFAGFARSMHFCGESGNGSKLKFIANLLVAINNVASAEAMVLEASGTIFEEAGIRPSILVRQGEAVKVVTGTPT